MNAQLTNEDDCILICDRCDAENSLRASPNKYNRKLMNLIKWDQKYIRTIFVIATIFILPCCFSIQIVYSDECARQFSSLQTIKNLGNTCTCPILLVYWIPSRLIRVWYQWDVVTISCTYSYPEVYSTIVQFCWKQFIYKIDCNSLSITFICKKWS